MMELRSAEKVREQVSMPRLLWIHRPIYVHARRDEEGEPCPCCGSRLAYITREIEHLDVIVDRVAGTRKALHRQSTDKARAAWYARAKQAKRLDMAIRCSEAQLPAIVDKSTKIITLFGGNRGGKTTAAAEWLTDQWVLRGGKGAKFWWVAPSRELTRVGVNKLILGETTDRFVQPLIPAALVRSFPANEQSADQTIRLVDGSLILLKWAGRSGDQLKGNNAIAIVLDEGSSVKHKICWSILVARTTDSKGQLMCPTTPVAGHWLQEYDRAGTLSYDDAANDQDYDPDVRRAHVKAKLTCFDNPWISEDELWLNIEASGGKDDPNVRREYFGEWVAEGRQLWRNFDMARHTVQYERRIIPPGYLDITNKIAQDTFRGMTQDPAIKSIGGIDYNWNPMSAVCCKVICGQDQDQTNPENWILYFEDEMLQRVRSTDEYAIWLSGQAGARDGRGLRADHFAGLHIVSDGTGFYRSNIPGSTKASTHSKRMRDYGFVVRAPMYLKGKPQNPPRVARISFFNELLWSNRIMINAVRCPGFIESLKTEIDDGTGDTMKTSGSAADRASGVTDAASYVAYAAFFNARAKSKAA